MMYLLIAVLCVSGGYVSAQAPAFCKGAECPMFTTISSTQLQTLVNNINNPQSYDNTYFMTATYDSPSVKTNRHNEVWLKKIA
ncbi:uncharacterized protein LOC130012393 [Patella vulgata]|uniref:uncharacterized protein LOC130012393 n=1 Tax=Patella vulgata TaxID=6465 RepID=UPI0024A884AA|nr:uncharacterized protein LOC130012393 [Patella vulgata]